MQEKQIYFVRHGQTEFNKRQRFLGRIDPELNSFGVEQAGEIKGILEKKGVEKAFSSPLKRASQTAEICFPKKVVFRDCLVERDFGLFDGKTRAEAIKMVKEAFPRKRFSAKGFEFVDDCLGKKALGGEGKKRLEKRVAECFEGIRKSRENRIVVFSHAIWIKTLLKKLGLLEPGFNLSTGGIIMLEIKGKKIELKEIR